MVTHHSRNRTPATAKAWKGMAQEPKHQERRRQARYLPWSRMTEQQRIEAIEAVRHGNRTTR